MIDRRKEDKPYKGKDKRKKPGIGTYHLSKNGQQYQFEGLLIQFDGNFNVWQVMDMSKAVWERKLFEVIGFENEKKAMDWAREYINKQKSETK